MGMRRGGCARRAMLGAVAAGALLGAARGTYTIDLDNQEADGGSAGDRTDDEYKVVTTAGLEIVIGPSAGSVYDIAPAEPGSNPSGLTFEIAVQGGKNAIVPSLCLGGYTLDASNGNIVCYGAERDPEPLVNTDGSLPVASGTNNPSDGFFAICPGDIDLAPNG